MAGQVKGNPWFISGFLLVIFLLGWHLFTLRPTFDPAGMTEEQLQLMEFNGDIVRGADGAYTWNPEKEKVKGVPGPLAVVEKARTELAEAFQIKGTNDHGIAYLVFYTVSRFAAGFLAASIIAIMLGVVLGLNRVLFRAINPYIQILKPISPLAWMPLLLYTVKDPKWTAILVVFMAALWPTLATTAFGVFGTKVMRPFQPVGLPSERLKALVALARSDARNSGCSCYAGTGPFVSLEADHAWSKSTAA